MRPNSLDPSWLEKGLAMGLAAVLAGCVLPVIPRNAAWRQTLSPSSCQFVVPGKTTRADVLLALGEPDYSVGVDATFVYWQSGITGGFVVFLAAGGGGAGAGISNSQELRCEIEFDQSGVVASSLVQISECGETWYGVGGSGSSSPSCKLILNELKGRSSKP
jgi:hypothetical protein